MQIENRLTAITFVGTLGGVLYVPFALASQPGANPFALWFGFPVGSGVVTGVCAWIGLRIADRANLAMPVLRPWETKQRGDGFEQSWMLRVSVAAGGIFGLAAWGVLHWFGFSGNPGTLVVRLATIPFAAVVPETVAHLLVMSAFVMLLKRTWIPILLSALIFLIRFHSPSVPTPAMADLVRSINFLFGVVTGWVYSRYGIEGAFLTHAVAHGILLGLS